MEKWFKDDEVNDLLVKLLDRLCTLERMAGAEAYGSALVLIPDDKNLPVLVACHGKPFTPSQMSEIDVEMVVKGALRHRRM